MKTNMNEKKKVLILCTSTSARSQMAEGLLRHLAGEKFEVMSVGVAPSVVRPEAVEAMREIGIDISEHRSKSADEFARQKFDFIITVCDNAKETCPFFPPDARREFIRALKTRRLSLSKAMNRVLKFSGACATKFVIGCESLQMKIKVYPIWLRLILHPERRAYSFKLITVNERRLEFQNL